MFKVHNVHRRWWELTQSYTPLYVSLPLGGHCIAALKAGLSEEKLSLKPCLVLNALFPKAKQLRIVLRHGIRPDFLEIHLL